MATINRATLARQVNGEIEYIYPKTEAELVEYESGQNVKQKIESIDKVNDAKINLPVDSEGNVIYGEEGQVLETNADGTTRWVSRARVYVGSGDMPEGYDVQIDPDAEGIEIDHTLTKEGAVADAKAAGDAIARLEEAMENIAAETSGDKLNAPVDSKGNLDTGKDGQVLESNGDGSTSWVDMPKIDESLDKSGYAADAKVTGDAIARLEEAMENIDDASKVNAPLNNEGDVINGTAGQVLETNGDGSTSWVSRARVYVGSDEMPEGYDVQIDPNATGIEIDTSLSKQGSVAEAKATGDAIEKLNTEAKKIGNKVNVPITNNAVDNGKDGQVLETNGDGTTSWVSRARVYVGAGEMPEGYDVQIDPDAASVEIDTTLTKEDAVADAKATGDAINDVYDYINYTAKDYTLLKDPTNGFVYIVKIENGQLVCISKCLSISVKTPPNKTQYSIGELFDPTGMVVVANCEDGNTRVLTKYGYPITPLADGTNKAMITYVENGVTFTTYVDISTSFDIEALLIDFTYTANADGTYTLTGWKGTLNGAASTECVIPDSELVVVNPAH